ncbi:FUSC family protein [Bacillus sp. B-jedd]|uniref:FUSC family protein n=1 Tax=Bacillus sp. B-jedd TaxID=1476857 RepID=UPI0005156666|nr:FUSC family protein [Bacillus sp. B-jedd]CEG28930.1 hypothetical protein BN1002_03855 [Bacillus sp. B-jedd]
MSKRKKDFVNKTLLVWKMAIASAIAWELAKLAGSSHPYLAPLSVILCLQTTIDRSIRFSLHRIGGTIVGVILITWLVSYFPLNGWALGLLLLAGCYAAKWLKMDETAIHQVALTILLLFTFERKSGDYGFDRIVDTAIGAAVAIVLQLILFPPNFTKEAANSFQKSARQLSGLLSEMANWIQSDWGRSQKYELEERLKNSLKDLHTAKETLQIATNSLKFNPLAKKHKATLKKYRGQLRLLENGYEYCSSVLKTLRVWQKSGRMSTQDRRDLENDLFMLGGFFAKAGKSGAANPLHIAEYELLYSKKTNKPVPGADVYKSSIDLETYKLLKSLR